MKKLLFILLLFPVLMYGQEGQLSKFGIDESAGLPQGLELKAKAPLFKVEDINGELIDFNDILKHKSIVIIFYRGRWCPVCNNYLRNVNDSLDMIYDKKAVVLAVGPETKESALITEEKTGADFVLIPDTSQQIMKAYDVLFKVTDSYQNRIKTRLFTDIAQTNGMKEAWLPVPATYIINQKGKIVYKQFEYDYRNRAYVIDMLKHLD